MNFLSEAGFKRMVDIEDVNGLSEALNRPNADFPNISKSVFVDMFKLAHKYQNSDVVIGLMVNYPLIVERICEQGEYGPVCNQLILYTTASAEEPNAMALRALMDGVDIVPKALTYMVRVNSSDIDAYKAVIEHVVLPEQDLKIETNEILYEFPTELLNLLYKTQDKVVCFDTLNEFIENISPLVKDDSESATRLDALKNIREEWKIGVGMYAKSERVKMINQSRKKLKRPKLG